MTRAREIALILLTAAIMFFAYQNLGPVDVTFLFWHLQVPVALIALVPLLAGLLIGAGSAAVFIRRRSKRGRATAREEEMTESERLIEEAHESLPAQEPESAGQSRPEKGATTPKGRPR